MAGVTYIHGTTPEEQSRLEALNDLTNPAFLEFLDLDEAEMVLEVGSGLGILTREIARKAPRASVIGLERSPAQMAAIRDVQPNLRFVQGDAHALEFPDHSFDVVCCRYLLEHVADPRRVLREMHRVLKPGGKVFIQENNIMANVFDPECPLFEHVWRQFAELQCQLGGDAMIGKKLLPMLRDTRFADVRLSIQAEVHYAGEAGLRGWLENHIANVEGAAASLQSHHLASAREIDAAISELRAFAGRNDASTFFYWNRAAARKPEAAQLS